MIKFLYTALLALTLVGCGQMSTTKLVDKVKPGTVLVVNQIDATTGGTGTGFILENNQIITNHHVVAGNGKIFIYSSNSQRKYDAEVVYHDAVADIAVVRLRDWELFEQNEMPVNLSFGNSDIMKQGDKVVVIGHPWGLTWTVSEGILSAKHRRVGMNPKFMNQVDANLFQGNSGGPIFNEKGQVVCVSTMMLAMEGGSYGFCVPSELVKKVIYDLNAFKEVRWRVLNITAKQSDDGNHVMIGSLDANGAAAKAGLKIDDKLLSIFTLNNHPNGIRITDMNTLITELALLKGDDEIIRLLIERNGEKLMIDVKTNHKLSSEYTPDKG
jgi:serine protease Do